MDLVIKGKAEPSEVRVATLGMVALRLIVSEVDLRKDTVSSGDFETV
jgi:hypothetical protein